MTRFIIFVTLLAIQLAYGISEKVVNVYDGSQMELTIRAESKYDKCKVKTNTGEEHEYKSGHHKVTDRIWSDDGVWGYYSCTIKIVSSNASDAGHWTITAYRLKNKSSTEQGNDEFDAETFEFTVYIIKTLKMIPAADLYVYEGQYVYAKMNEELKNVQKCETTGPKNNVVDLLSKQEENIELFGNCGFRMTVNSSHNGDWNFKATVDDFVLYRSTLRIRVIENNNEEEDLKVIQLQRGKRGEINIAPQAAFCQLVSPRGIKLPLMHGGCRYKIPVVTIYHEGIWFAQYGIQGKLEVTQETFQITTYETFKLNGKATVTKNNDIELICNVEDNIERSFDFCRFTRPDGKLLNLSPGIGTIQYSTFNVSSLKSRHSKMSCGLRIHHANIYDYGSWKCEVGSIYSDFYAGTLIYVGQSLSQQEQDAVNAAVDVPLEIKAKDVYVKRGDPFVIKCVANMALDYCWFLSPNGTRYFVSRSQESATETRLPYEGAGLSLGECGARIDHAVSTDEGVWTCNIGATNSVEDRAMIVTKVSDSYLIADESEITLYDGQNLLLSCNVLPSVVDREVNYCRWVRPDGFGFYNTINGQYVTTNSNTHCRLLILDNNYDRNIGRWTCVAGLFSLDVEEAWATITVYPKSSMKITSLIGLILGTITIFTAIICLLIKINDCRRRRVQSKLPPSYSESERSPKSLHP